MNAKENLLRERKKKKNRKRAPEKARRQEILPIEVVAIPNIHIFHFCI